MKLLAVLMLCALASAAPKSSKKIDIFAGRDVGATTEGRNNVLANALVRQLFAYLRYVIQNGSVVFDSQPLDPLLIDEYNLYMPTGLINLNLHLLNVFATGMGDFVVNHSHVNMDDLTLDVDITIPFLDIRAGSYDFVGDLYSAIPLYGKGEARFEVDNFRFKGLLYLVQSEDGLSVLVDRIVSPSYETPVLRSYLTGVIGGGDIDIIVNAIIEDVILDYINRFQAIIARNVADWLVIYGNPLLDQLDTWKYVAPLLPRPPRP